MKWLDYFAIILIFSVILLFLLHIDLGVNQLIIGFNK